MSYITSLWWLYLSYHLRTCSFSRSLSGLLHRLILDFCCVPLASGFSLVEFLRTSRICILKFYIHFWLFRRFLWDIDGSSFRMILFRYPRAVFFSSSTTLFVATSFELLLRKLSNLSCFISSIVYKRSSSFRYPTLLRLLIYKCSSAHWYWNALPLPCSCLLKVPQDFWVVI